MQDTDAWLLDIGDPGGACDDQGVGAWVIVGGVSSLPSEQVNWGKSSPSLGKIYTLKYLSGCINEETVLLQQRMHNHEVCFVTQGILFRELSREIGGAIFSCIPECTARINTHINTFFWLTLPEGLRNRRGNPAPLNDD